MRFADAAGNLNAVSAPLTVHRLTSFVPVLGPAGGIVSIGGQTPLQHATISVPSPWVIDADNTFTTGDALITVIRVSPASTAGAFVQDIALSLGTPSLDTATNTISVPVVSGTGPGAFILSIKSGMFTASYGSVQMLNAAGAVGGDVLCSYKPSDKIDVTYKSGVPAGGIISANVVQLTYSSKWPVYVPDAAAVAVINKANESNLSLDHPPFPIFVSHAMRFEKGGGRGLDILSRSLDVHLSGPSTGGPAVDGPILSALVRAQ